MIWLLVGLACGIAGTWFIQRGELAYLRKELAIAQDRLLHAWRDEKAVIPPRPAPPPVPLQPLPEMLQGIVDDWEDPESKAIQEGQIRMMLESGLKPEAIWRHFENSHPD